jgi:hypothetical protein
MTAGSAEIMKMPIEKYMAICDILAGEDGAFKQTGAGISSSLIQLSDLREVPRGCLHPTAAL